VTVQVRLDLRFSNKPELKQLSTEEIHKEFGCTMCPFTATYTDFKKLTPELSELIESYRECLKEQYIIHLARIEEE